MLRWLAMFSGLLIWGLHFMGVYAIASIADVVADADAAIARAAVGVFTAACVAALVAIFVATLRRARPADDVDGLVHLSAQVGSGVSIIAVLWQGLPVIVP